MSVSDVLGVKCYWTCFRKCSHVSDECWPMVSTCRRTPFLCYVASVQIYNVMSLLFGALTLRQWTARRLRGVGLGGVRAMKSGPWYFIWPQYVSCVTDCFCDIGDVEPWQGLSLFFSPYLHWHVCNDQVPRISHINALIIIRLFCSEGHCFNTNQSLRPSQRCQRKTADSQLWSVSNQPSVGSKTQHFLLLLHYGWLLDV